ncbi:MAG: sigma-70 family RNA polymerase sigma factor [Deltaproteobacteria bacterium]|nr:sigma-70 family RNA polymerase sigma factor [Deltaproteobacteria bacterium]
MTSSSTARFAAAFATARAAWPELTLDEEALAARLLAVAGDDDTVLESLHVGDLQLALACARGDERALAAFARTFDSRLEGAAAAVAPRNARDVAQDVREKLLAGRDGREPRIAAYDGRGPLQAWLRVVVTREALSTIRKTSREVLNDDDALFDRATTTTDPELAFVKETHRRDFKEAFVDALADLTPRERNLLRHHYVDEATLIEIGAIYGAHKTTVGRWLEGARAKLLEGARSRLMKRFNADSAELMSLINLVRSQLEVGLAEALGEPET